MRPPAEGKQLKVGKKTNPLPVLLDDCRFSRFFDISARADVANPLPVQKIQRFEKRLHAVIKTVIARECHDIEPAGEICRDHFWIVAHDDFSRDRDTLLRKRGLQPTEADIRFSQLRTYLVEYFFRIFAVNLHVTDDCDVNTCRKLFTCQLLHFGTSSSSRHEYASFWVYANGCNYASWRSLSVHAHACRLHRFSIFLHFRPDMQSKLPRRRAERLCTEP